MSNAAEAVRVIEQALNSTFSEFDFKRDQGETGHFPRIYRRTLIGGVGVFVDVCIIREGFAPDFPGQLPVNPKLEGWVGVYLVDQPNMGKRFRLFSCKDPSELTLQNAAEFDRKLRNLITIWNNNKIINEKHNFDGDFIDV